MFRDYGGHPAEPAVGRRRTGYFRSYASRDARAFDELERG